MVTNVKPTLTLFVQPHCTSCERARRVLNNCTELRALADIVIRDVSVHEDELPESFVGVPTTVFHGEVVALGTPDCADLVRLIRAYTVDEVDA